MKLVAFALSLGLLHAFPPSLLLLDTTYRTTPIETDGFVWDMYTNKKFPIYAEDRKAIIEGVKRLAKLINNAPACHINDTVAANHSRFILSVRCDNNKTYTVRFQTRITEQNLTCNIELSNKEADSKKAQRNLIDLATYLEQDD